MNKRLEYIDIVKGLAIIFVVAGHLLQFNFRSVPYEEIFNWIYSFHMTLFMCLCGYVAAFNFKKVQGDSSFSLVHILFIKIFVNTFQLVVFRSLPLFIGIIVSFIICFICIFVSNIIRLIPYGGFLFFGSKKYK